MSDLVEQLQELLPTLLEQTGITLTIVVVSLVLGGIGGLVVGTALYVTRAGGVLAQPVAFWVLNALVNTIRPIPFIIFLVAVQPLARIVLGTGLGTEVIIFSISIAATFGIARIVEQNLISVDPGVIEAARAMGAGPWRIIRTVILPEAFGPLILGYTFATVALIDMSSVASIIGGEGLGAYALDYGYRRFDEVVTFSALLIIIVVTQVVQAFGNWLARRVLRH